MDTTTRKPVVAIVGRQNVGKSTLLNRLVGKNLAIVDDFPGTTRDRIMASVSYHGTDFDVVDTGGIELRPESPIASGINEQVEIAIRDADVIVFLLDIRDGIIPSDLEIADRLRKTEKPLIVVANKADNRAYESRIAEFYQLGLGVPIPISAYHGRGTGDMLDSIVNLLPASTFVETETERIKVAIVGRPNVGKSTLLNAITGTERSIVDSVPGTTRDSLDTSFDFNGKSMLLIDTGGIRRRGRIKGGVERYSLIRTMRAIDRADIALLVLDAMELVTAQDMHVAGYISEAFKGIVVLVNKSDMIDTGNIPDISGYVHNSFKFITYAPLQFVSAKDKWGVDKIMPQVVSIYQERQKRLPTASVNSVVQRAVADHTLPHKGKQQLKILYATQPEVNPPTFVFFVNNPDLVHFSYYRYLEKKLRQAFGFSGTAIRLIFKARVAQ